MDETIQTSRYQLVDLFHQNQQELMRFLISKVSNTHDAEDVLQDLFIRVSDLDRSLAYEIKKPKPYLFTIANNMAMDYLRKNARRSAHLSDSKGAEIGIAQTTPDPPDSILDAQQQAERLRMALSVMPAKRRQTFLLFKYRNLTRAEISTELGLSIDAVEKHLVRALRNCRDALQQGDLA